MKCTLSVLLTHTTTRKHTCTSSLSLSLFYVHFHSHTRLAYSDPSAYTHPCTRTHPHAHVRAVSGSRRWTSEGQKMHQNIFPSSILRERKREGGGGGGESLRTFLESSKQTFFLRLWLRRLWWHLVAEIVNFKIGSSNLKLVNSFFPSWNFIT